MDDRFLAYAQSEYNSENIEFLRAVRAFRKNPTLDGAQSIWHKFFNKESKLQINLSAGVVETIQKLLASGHIDMVDLLTLFDQATAGILNLVENDTLRRFKNTNEYIKKYGSPEKKKDEKDL